MLRFFKAILLSPLLQSNLSVNLSIKTCGLEVLIFSELVNIVSVFYFCIDLIMLLYTFLVISFVWIKEQTIFLISFNTISELLPAFTCAITICNFWSISELVNKVSNFYICIDLIMLLYTFLVISFGWFKEQAICLILFNKRSELLPDFTCARAIDNLWSICLGVLLQELSVIFEVFVFELIFQVLFQFFFINSFRSRFCIFIK